MVDASTPDVGPLKKLSRRDFFKVVGATAGGVALAVNGINGIEVNPNPHFVNALKVVKELDQAKKSEDPQRIYESRKLAIVWLFAETAAMYSEEMGIGGAGITMEHYLYGKGEPLDVSFILEKVTGIMPERFVGKLISFAVRNREGNTIKDVTVENDYQFTKRAIRELKSETGLKTDLDARDIVEWQELYYAFGGAKYELHAPEAHIESVVDYAQHLVLEKGIEITATDRYRWQFQYEASLPSDAGWAVEHLSEPLFDQFYKSRDIVEKTVEKLGLSDEQRDEIMDIYSSDRKEKLKSDLRKSSRDAISRTIESLTGDPDLKENDFNLLKKLGAMEYDMKGYVRIPNRLEFIV